MFPEIKYEKESKNYRQQISTNPPSREDVNTLQKLLDEKLVVRQARYIKINQATQASAPFAKNFINNALMK